MRGQAESFSLAVPTDPRQQDVQSNHSNGRLACTQNKSGDCKFPCSICLRLRTAEKPSMPISMRPQSPCLRPEWLLSLSAGLSEMLGVTQLRLKGLAVNESLCCRTLGDGRPCESEGDVKLCRIPREECVRKCRFADSLPQNPRRASAVARSCGFPSSCRLRGWAASLA